jgi:3-hydroxyisobutyrate dehydrogenase
VTAVAVLGTGIMGLPMARNLARAGHEVRAWNRTREKAEPLRDEGATVAGSSAEAAEGADVLITMLADAHAVAAAVEDVRGVPAWAQMSTVGIEATDRFAALAADRGIGFVDAPVLGTKEPAEKAQLVLLAAGAPELRDRVHPVFDAVGRETVWLADHPGPATRLKLVLNHWILGLVENIGETIAFAEAVGVDPRDYLSSIEGGAMNTPYAHMKGNAILNDALGDAAFPARLARKDVGLVLDAAREAGIELPLMQVAARQFDRTIELGHGDDDMAATYHAARASSGASASARS